MSRHLAALFLLSLLGMTFAVPPAPLPPETYHVLIRYEIFSYREERLRKYADLLQALKNLGFIRDADEIIAEDEPDNPKATRMRGTLSSKSVDALVKTQHIRSLLVMPREAKLPEKGRRVRVDMTLSSGYSPEMQRALSRQTVDALTKDAGFIEAIGYDRRDHTRLVGSVPVENLEKLVEDVRDLPSAARTVSPMRTVSPVKLTVVRPDWAVPSGSVRMTPIAPKEVKFTQDLRTLLASPDATKSARLEVILGWTPERSDRGWQRLIEQSGAIVEGSIGPLVTVYGIPKDIAPSLAEIPEIAHIRLPRSGRVHDAGVVDAAPNWQAMRGSGQAKLLGIGRRGLGTRIAVVADDFAGWDKLKSSRPELSLVDLTMERSRDLKPDPVSTTGEGAGTRYARALMKTLPESDYVLVRVDANAPYMLQTLAQAINGEPVRSVSLDRRIAELRNSRELLDRESQVLAEERQRVFADPVADEAGLRAQTDYRKKRDAHEAEVKSYDERRSRYFTLLRDLQKLKGVRVVASALTWLDGYPLEGTSGLSRYFEDRPFSAAMWFHDASDARPQEWSGLFRDNDRNGIMEFVGPKIRLPDGSWSSELNFLGWQPAKGAAGRLIPANTRLRFSLQWREAHDPLPLRQGDDVYREPLSKLGMNVVYQPDPNGKSRPADDLTVVATTVGPPTRLHQTLNSATYEQVIELDVKTTGRYGVLVTGELATGIQAVGENSLPSARRATEVRPRLFVRTLTGAGRAYWTDFVP